MRIRKILTVGVVVAALLLLIVMPAQAGTQHEDGERPHGGDWWDDECRPDWKRHGKGHHRPDDDPEPVEAVAETTVTEQTSVEGTSSETPPAEEATPSDTGTESEQGTGGAEDATEDEGGERSGPRTPPAFDDDGEGRDWDKDHHGREHHRRDCDDHDWDDHDWDDHDWDDDCDGGWGWNDGHGDHDDWWGDHDEGDRDDRKHWKKWKHHDDECDEPADGDEEPSEDPSEGGEPGEDPDKGDDDVDVEDGVDVDEAEDVIDVKGVSSEDVLASTGLDSVAALFAGLGLVGAGGGALYVNRRRREDGNAEL